jgi:hypothetical protein
VFLLQSLIDFVTLWIAPKSSFSNFAVVNICHKWTSTKLRFFAGGLMVSAFAAVGDVLRPKSFAGLFGAAPSIAIATLLIALFKQGPLYAATEGHSMVLGAAALAAYSLISCQLVKRFQLSGLAVAQM